jgi:chromate transporter
VGPLQLDLPEWASLDSIAALLSAAALLAVFRFKLGVLPVIGGAAAAGLLLRYLLP